MADIEEGWYFYRERAGKWWRATHVMGGMATAGWIDGEIPASQLEGQWRGPVAEDDPDMARARQDAMGRLKEKRPEWETGPDTTAPLQPPPLDSALILRARTALNAAGLPGDAVSDEEVAGLVVELMWGCVDPLTPSEWWAAERWWSARQAR
jgi:hypothetical protein